MNAELLTLHNLQIQRGGRITLQIEHLDIFRGETLAVVGPNGAGKSTLLLTLARLLKPQQGEILFNGKPVSQESDTSYRRRIGLVMQDPLLFDTSVFDNVATGLRFRGVQKSEIAPRVDQWLERFGVLHLKGRRANELSGGEAQRVSLSRAFVLEPDLILLDEPFSALDSPTRSRLLDDLQLLLAETEMTTAFITHDLNEARKLGDRVAVLLGGRLRQVDLPQAVFNNPADPEVAAFVGVETIIPGIVQTSNAGLLTIKTAQGTILETIGDATPGKEALLCLRPEDITLSLPDAANPHSSARNRLTGTVVRLLPQGTLVRVIVDCGFPIVALITQQSAAELALAAGQQIQAAFKATAGHLIVR